MLEKKLNTNTKNKSTIRPIKNSWGKYELIANLIKYREDYEQFKKDCYFSPNQKEIEEWTNRWINQNL